LFSISIPPPPATPTLGSHNFLIFDSFLTIFIALNMPRGGLQLFWTPQIKEQI
jgi:hypothetical protein